jgi:hypothetical protein
MNKSRKPRSKKSRKPRSKKSRKPRSKKSRKPRSKKSRKPRSKKSRKPRSKKSRKPRSKKKNDSISLLKPTKKNIEDINEIREKLLIEKFLIDIRNAVDFNEKDKKYEIKHNKISDDLKNNLEKIKHEIYKMSRSDRSDETLDLLRKFDEINSMYGITY